MARYSLSDSGFSRQDNWKLGEWFALVLRCDWGMETLRPMEMAAYLRVARVAFWDKSTFSLTERKPGTIDATGNWWISFGFNSDEELRATCLHFDELFRRQGDLFISRTARRGRHGAASTKEHIPSEIRWAVWERDNFTCKHCGTRKHLSVDHIHPESAGGTLDMRNLQTLCKPCNSRKYNKLPEAISA